MLDFFSFLLNHWLTQDVIFWIKRLWFLWAPLILGYFFWKSWLLRVQLSFVNNISWVLLEIKIPRDVFKGPRAMETVLTSLHGTCTYKGSWWKRVIHGFLQSWYSLEIVGIDGGIRFFVRCQKFSRNFVESQFYAQFPNVEITEVDDYVYASDFENLNEWDLWGAELKLEKEDAYPIKTYMDFGLDDSLIDEEKKINPLVSFLEFLGHLKQGEQMWMQILIRGAGSKWIDEGKEVIDNLIGRSSNEEEENKKLSKGENEVISAIEKNINKLGFETRVRIIYSAKKDLFNKANASAMSGLVKLYSTHSLNGFKLTNKTEDVEPLEFVFKKKREFRNKMKMLDAFRKRSYFHVPYKRDSFVFNTEELATIFHLPGRVAETPSFARIDSKKSGPPPTLPV